MNKKIFILLLLCCFSLLSCNQSSPDEKSEEVIKKTQTLDFEYTNTPGPDIVGGYCKIVAEPNKYNDSSMPYYVIMRNHTPFEVTKHNNTIVTIELGNVDNLNGSLGEYKITLMDGAVDLCEILGEPLLDWTTDHIQDNGTITLNLSEYVQKTGVNVRKAYLYIYVKRDTVEEKYILVKSIVITSNTEKEDEINLLQQISFTDANKVVLMEKDETGFPIGYWRCSGRKELYNGKKMKK